MEPESCGHRIQERWGIAFWEKSRYNEGRKETTAAKRPF
jgi:hypothetical protein